MPATTVEAIYRILEMGKFDFRIKYLPKAAQAGSSCRWVVAGHPPVRQLTSDLSHLGQGGLGGRESSPLTIHASSLLSLAPRPLEPHVPAQIWEAGFLASNSSFITHGVQEEGFP